MTLVLLRTTSSSGRTNATKSRKPKMTDPLAITLHEHHSRFIPPLGRVTGDQLVRKLIIVICRPHDFFRSQNSEVQNSGVRSAPRLTR